MMEASSIFYINVPDSTCHYVFSLTSALLVSRYYSCLQCIKLMHNEEAMFVCLSVFPLCLLVHSYVCGLGDSSLKLSDHYSLYLHKTQIYL